MSRNLARTNCRTCDSKVVITGIPYKGDGVYQQGQWLADATCTVCGTKYTAWTGPSTTCNYGTRQTDLNLLIEHGFYDLSYRSTFNDEAGTDDLPKERVETFRVIKVGEKQFWIKED